MTPWLYAVGRLVCGLAIRLCFRWEVAGVENVPAAGPLLVCANHRTYWDPPMVGLALPRPVFFMAKEELFRIPVLGRLIRSVGAFPVRRGAADLQGLRRALALLRAGQVVGVFPEGRRVRTAPLGEGEPGVVLLAAATGAPVLPVAIHWGRGFRARVRVLIGEPVDVRRHVGEGRRPSRDLAAVANDVVMGRIRDLLDRAAAAAAKPVPDSPARMIQ